MRTDTRIRLRYLRETVELLYPGPGACRPYSVLPHAVLPRRLAPRRWWHAALGARVDLPVEGSIESRLSEVLGTRVRTVVRVRPARRANRKPVLEAYDGSGLVAFVKIGDSERARELVDAEAAALTRLADLPLKSVVAPSVLHHGDWRGQRVLALTPLPGRPGRVPADLLAAAVTEIASTGPGAWHGDLTPWNVAPSGDGRLLVWDWERYGHGVPLGFDALHHHFHRCLRRMKPAVAAEACVAGSLRTLEPYGYDAAEARRTALAYLVTLATRHAHDGHEPLGPSSGWLTPLADREEAWL